MSCADVQTIQAGNGSKTQFSFDFPYLFKSEIQVSFWNATTKEWDVIATTDATYPWQVTDANPTIVEFTSTAPPAPAVPVDPNETSVDNVRIKRVTNIDDIRALFNPGSAIRSDDLNKNFEQLRYAIQEANCQGISDEMYQYLLDNYWDRFDNTLYSTEAWRSDDATIATTAALDQRFQDEANETIRSDEAWVENDDTVPTTLAAATQFDTIVQTGTPAGSGWAVGKTWLQNDDNLTLSVWNGSAWLGIASGGTFTNQPKVVYVDATAGDDNNDGHRVSRPKATIKAAINQINADSTYGDGSVVVVAPGVYQEVAPIDITKKDVSVIGQALRSCIVHPTVATETNSLFRVNSGSYLANLTFTGMKASGTRGHASSVDPDATYGLPENQGWNVSFYPNATIVKSPYIQNCTNFSDSEIDNSNLNAHTPAGGSAGDTDSAMTGGGILIDGAVVNDSSPLRSMVCDSYTHVGLDGPAILVTNNGYCQATSSYAFFTHYHIKCLNGGQANLAASTTDFGRYSLVADGRSVDPVFTASLSTSANDGDITFTIGAPTADPSWHGTATRPQSNMLVELNGITYPVLSAVANGAGWDVTISRPDPANKSSNLGLNGAVSTPATAEFFLRSMIASSGHTMEYVGSGTNYSALPENGGIPDDTAQVVELNNGKIWTAITDHNGKFTVGPLEIDQRTGAITIEAGATVTNVVDDPSPQLGGDLDANGNDIILATGTAAEPSLRFDADANTGIYSPGADQVAISTGGSGRLFINSSGQVGVGTSPVSTFHVNGTGRFEASQSLICNGTNGAYAAWLYNGTFVGDIGTANQAISGGSNTDFAITTRSATNLVFGIGTVERMRLDSSGRLGLGNSSPGANLDVYTSSSRYIRHFPTSGLADFEVLSNNNSQPVFAVKGTGSADLFRAYANTTQAVTIDSSGRVGIGTTSPAFANGSGLEVQVAGVATVRVDNSTSSSAGEFFADSTGTTIDCRGVENFRVNLGGAEKARIDSSGRLGLGVSDPGQKLVIGGGTNGRTRIKVDSGSGNFGKFEFSTDSSLTTSAVQVAEITANITGTGPLTSSLQFATNSGNSLNTAMTIDASQRVGIGTTSATELLSVNGNLWLGNGGGSGGSEMLRIWNDGGVERIHASNNPSALAFGIGGSSSAYERMRLDTSGRLLVGTSSARSSLGAIQVETAGTVDRSRYEAFTNINSSAGTHITLGKSRGTTAGSNTIVQSGDQLGSLNFHGTDGSTDQRAAQIECNVDGTPGANDMPGRLVFSTTADGASSPTERMRINAAGAVINYIPSTTADTLNVYNTTASAYRFYVTQGGTVFATNTTISAISDQRQKENIRDLDVGLNEILALKPRVFDWKEGCGKNIKNDKGFVAQEFEQIFPDLVDTWKGDAPEGEEPYKSVRQDLIPVLVKAIQEQQSMIAELQAEVAALKGA